MLPYRLNRERTFKITIHFFVFLLSFYSLPGFSQETTIGSPTPQQMLANIATQVPNLMRMVTAAAYVMGVYFMVMGLFKLKQYGESRTMMSHERELKGPLIYLAVGALLIYLPTSISIGLSSFWVNPNPYAYLQEENQWNELVNVAFLIIQFIGTIAFIRGLVILTHLGGQGGQPEKLGKALTHIIGGILCINLYQFVQVIMATLGIET